MQAKKTQTILGFAVGLVLAAAVSTAVSAEADFILHNGKVATVDEKFSIHEAIAIEGGRILEVGRSSDLMTRRGPRTQVVDLQGRLVLPGLMDSHTHPAEACMTEFDHPIPPMERIQDVL